MDLTLWIAMHVKHLDDLLTYVDDVLSYGLEGNMSWYVPYQKPLPAKQAWLLKLWDELGVCHDELKQVFGPMLTIIGFVVDPNTMTITMPPQSCADLIDAV